MFQIREKQVREKEKPKELREEKEQKQSIIKTRKEEEGEE